MMQDWNPRRDGLTERVGDYGKQRPVVQSILLYRSRFPLSVALIGSGFAGMLIALQSRVNGGLGRELGNGYVAAALSFGAGLLVMCVAMLMSRQGRSGLATLRTELTVHRLPVWALFGGAAGAFFVLGQGLIAPLTGLALFTVGIIAGQVVAGLILDSLGLGLGGRINPTALRLVGTALVVVAVVVSVSADVQALRAMWLVAFPILAGAGLAWQSMVNGLLRASARSVIAATFVSFVVGTAVLVVAAFISVAVSGWPAEWPSSPLYYIGGFVGTVFIAIAATLVRTVGVLLLSMSNVVGQLVAAVAFEAVLPLHGGLTPGMLAGSLIALLAVVIAALPSRLLRDGNSRHPH
ncbi:MULTISPECIES: DMT family transporter [unclassified Nitrobacter]|uniref:DMT family transporter n=1 Tax=unclassified Nitrobacter TaxID=2620411 RepID=UPI001AC13D95|nr:MULTISPECIES: DMT family transporter [unclassified Nitrobacter]MBN9147094.1 DMT family transporter [Nitrobacter sp.]